MPKRKAETSLTSSSTGGISVSTPKKRSKKEAVAEAKARARAWHESRRNVVGGDAPAPNNNNATSNHSIIRRGTKTTAAAATPGRKLTATTTSPTTTKKASEDGTTKRRRTPASTATTSSTTSFFSPSVPNKTRSTTTTTTGKKSRRSLEPFEFVAPPAAESSSSSSSFTNQSLLLPSSRKFETTRAVDPPPSAATLPIIGTMAEAGSVSRSANVAAAATTTTTTTTTTSSSTTSSTEQHSKRQIPASIASLFSTNAPTTTLQHSSNKKSSQNNNKNDPPYQQFDPSQPYPTVGYKLRTAAYCGCGPTPNSNTIVSARASSSATTAVGAASISQTQNSIHTTRTVPFTTPRVQYSTGSFVDSMDDSGELEEKECDDRKLPHKRPAPSSSSSSSSGQCTSHEVHDAVDGEQSQLRHQSDPLPDAGLLANAILRARGILSSAAASNQRRREGMGIQNVPSKNEQGIRGGLNYSPSHGGLSSRYNEVLMTNERVNVSSSHTSSKVIDGIVNSERLSMDPPIIHSSSSISPPPPSSLLPVRQATSAVVASRPTSALGTVIELKSNHGAIIDSSPVSSTHLSLIKTTCRKVGKLLIVISVLIMGIIFLLSNISERQNVISLDHSSSFDTDLDRTTTCFTSHHLHATDSDSDQSINQCDGRGKPCPQWGRCSEGKLLDCAEDGGDNILFEGLHRFVPSAKGDRCVPSHEAKVLTKSAQDSLMQMTSDLVCTSGWNDDDTTFPLFHSDKVIAKMRETVNDEKIKAALTTSELLLWLSPVFESDLVQFGSLLSENGSHHNMNAIGLGRKVPPNSLPLPFRCRASLMFWELLGYVIHCSWGIVWLLSKKLFFVITRYPLYSFVTVALWKVGQYFKRRRRHRIKVRELHGIVLEAVYDRLSECEDHEGYAALMLRDDVGHDIYPTNFAQRIFINDFVWPRVTLEIRADNRVRKFRKLTNGKELEHWDFAVQSKRGRRLRKSLGTPVVTLDGAKSDEFLSRREP